MLTVHVPATSANVGAGFDTLGLALGFGNTVEMEEADGCVIESLDGIPVPTGEDNLVYQAASHLYGLCGRAFSGLHLRQQSPIPTTRGLGSSSACIVAGLVGANALMKNPMTRHELLEVAAEMEGHPDNVAPAMLGGLVASCIESGRVYSVKKEISPTLRFGVFVPDYELRTAAARAALPKQVLHKDAVFNLSRAVLCQAALCEGRLDLLPTACEDRLHQRYRLGMMPGAEEVFALAHKAGARAVYVSGAGPAIVAVVEARDEAFWPKAEAALQAARGEKRAAGCFTLAAYAADNMGARLI